MTQTGTGSWIGGFYFDYVASRDDFLNENRISKGGLKCIDLKTCLKSKMVMQLFNRLCNVFYRNRLLNLISLNESLWIVNIIKNNGFIYYRIEYQIEQEK